MKATLSLALILAAGVTSVSHAATQDVVVASNLTDAQVDTNAWEEVGLISPAYNNYKNRPVGQSFCRSRVES